MQDGLKRHPEGCLLAGFCGENVYTRVGQRPTRKAYFRPSIPSNQTRKLSASARSMVSVKSKAHSIPSM